MNGLCLIQPFYHDYYEPNENMKLNAAVVIVHCEFLYYARLNYIMWFYENYFD